MREGEGRLEQAIRELRALQGPEAILDLVEVKPDSHVPEASSALVPFSAERRARRRREREVNAALAPRPDTSP
ncbi:MAG: hypothetical protein JST59_30270 [Actinobacteria bacterium]|nr:hypothetical protein [Actinomycetota bacterium]